MSDVVVNGDRVSVGADDDVAVVVAVVDSVWVCLDAVLAESGAPG